MLTPPFFFPPDDTCPPPPAAAAPAPRPDLPGDVALGPDGLAHLLVRDDYAVCWWTVDEDGASALVAVWPAGGPAPEALSVAEDGSAVLLGRGEGGLWVARVGVEGRVREAFVPVTGRPLRLELAGDGRVVRLVLRDAAGVSTWWRVDLDAGRVELLATLPAVRPSALGLLGVGAPLQFDVGEPPDLGVGAPLNLPGGDDAARSPR